MLDGSVRVNLNLLRTFVAVYEAASFTTAAERLFVTPPAVSQAIQRLRQDLDDVLFTRIGRIVQPSPLAEALYPQLRDALLSIDRALAGVHGFDPATSEHRFTIALSELGEIRYLPVILREAHAAAPNVTIKVEALDVDSLEEWLVRGRIDLAITSSPVGDRVLATTLQAADYVALMSKQNPLANAEMTLDQYRKANHVVVRGDSGFSAVRGALQTLGIRMDPTVIVNHFAALPPLLTMEEFIATVPDSLAKAWAVTWPVVARPLPFEVDQVDVRLCKRTTSIDAAALEWFSSLVERTARTTPERYFAITNDAQTSSDDR